MCEISQSIVGDLHDRIEICEISSNPLVTYQIKDILNNAIIPHDLCAY